MTNTPIYQGLAQSDLDMNHFNLLNWSGGGGGGGGGGLDANTVTADDIGLVGDGVTDNSTALQAWIDSVGAAQVNSTLLVPDGVYIFSGPLQDPSARNAQILLPSVAISVPSYTITIKGYHPLSPNPWISTIPGPLGPIFRSTLATGGGTLPCFFGGCGPPNVDSPNLSFMGVCFEDMIFQTVQNPLITCLNLERYINTILRGDVIIMAGTRFGLGVSDTVQPTTSTSCGLILPHNNSGILCQLNNVTVSNFYTGVSVGEFTHAVNLLCQACIYSLEYNFAYHSSMLDRFTDIWSTNGINVKGAHTFLIKHMDIERGSDSAWFTRVNDVYDPSNLATADITWWTVKTGIGAQNIFTVNGGANVQTRQIGTVQGTDLRWVRLSGGGKLQARNPGTNTWTDVDQWTNP